jgi:hypothetical protein
VSQLHEKVRREYLAQQEFERHAQRLRLELDSGIASLEHLDLRLRVLELLIEQTGGNLITQQYRRELESIRTSVSLQTEQRRKRARHLAAVRE